MDGFGLFFLSIQSDAFDFKHVPGIPHSVSRVYEVSALKPYTDFLGSQPPAADRHSAAQHSAHAALPFEVPRAGGSAEKNSRFQKTHFEVSEVPARPPARERTARRGLYSHGFTFFVS